MFENGRRISCAFQFLSNLRRQKKGANNHKKKRGVKKTTLPQKR
jgi:hypothetical protein